MFTFPTADIIFFSNTVAYTSHRLLIFRRWHVFVSSALDAFKSRSCNDFLWHCYLSPLNFYIDQ